MAWTTDPAAIRAALDEWARLRALPYYGGNKIPDSYLRKFGTYVKGEQSDDALPNELATFVRDM